MTLKRYVVLWTSLTLKRSASVQQLLTSGHVVSIDEDEAWR